MTADNYDNSPHVQQRVDRVRAEQGLRPLWLERIEQESIRSQAWHKGFFLGWGVGAAWIAFLWWVCTGAPT